MIPVPKKNTGKHHSRFDSTELILLQKNKAIVRSEDPEKLSPYLNYLINFLALLAKDSDP